ncbi:hypothetical protein H4Q26_005093 [Puccinia striiformis f. sp. tritici PST-130]|nr:hypothetical protein H4Q26_005093 [Puccinia striiformis f. sp. tritici PST-130]
MPSHIELDLKDKPYTLLETPNMINEPPMHHSSLCLHSRIKSLFKPVRLFQVIFLLCLVMTMLRLYPLSNHLPHHTKAYRLTFSIDSLTPGDAASASSPASASIPSSVSTPHLPLPLHPPSTEHSFGQYQNRPSARSFSPRRPSSAQATTAATSYLCRTVRPLRLFIRYRIRREFNPPDELVTQRSPTETISSTDSSDKSSTIITQVWSSIRDTYCQHPLLASEAALTLLDRSAPSSSSLQATISVSVNTLQVGLPTEYIFTKTSALGRTGGLRPDYFRRHVKAIRDHLSAVARRGGKYLDETEKKWGTGRRQLVWISGLAFIYFAYGPTRHHGNAQQNSAYALIHRLSQTVLGHGPVMSIDDDGKVLSEVFDIAWRVQTFGVWPMGNLGPTGWEGPEYDPVTLEFITWRQAPKDDRPFPLDNGAFVFSTEVFGSNFRLVGPRYWPTDYPGGESEFVSQIIDKQELVEPLCYNCQVAWHNQKLPEDCIQHLPSCQEL